MKKKQGFCKAKKLPKLLNSSKLLQMFVTLRVTRKFFVYQK